ncbi:hypothetical protein FHS39_002417 [Streptomyces olivoverticillatus]|uniref:Uncharacterized protein n=1 Tax=Streptomyces olivoverticillatus TaxID=66427 RepID=A0A7W7LPH2_9ACTN|nr:hypothetical protein [Streptomyces olivoverticillatus]
MRRLVRQYVLAPGAAAVTLSGSFFAPAAHAAEAWRPGIPDCVGVEGGHDNPSLGLTNREWVLAENGRLGYDRYATCRFVIEHRSSYVNLHDKSTSDTFGACDGPKWGLELKTLGASTKSSAESHGRSVTDLITASIANGVSIALSGTRTRDESTTWSDTVGEEDNFKIDVPAGKRVYLQTAPWFRRSAGYLQMTYWRDTPGRRSRVENIDLITHTPLFKADGSLRLDHQTKWLPCPSRHSEDRPEDPPKDPPSDPPKDPPSAPPSDPPKTKTKTKTKT